MGSFIVFLRKCTLSICSIHISAFDTLRKSHGCPNLKQQAYVLNVVCLLLSMLHNIGKLLNAHTHVILPNTQPYITSQDCLAKFPGSVTTRISGCTTHSKNTHVG